MTLMCLSRAADTFGAGVAGAPVTHWDGYDTHYTERYMGLPAENAEGYRDSSPLTHAERIAGRLMLVHGLIDENVHFRHTARLVNALIRARKEYELLLFPDERHMPRREEDRVYMEERIRDFLVASLRAGS
jgi:dipeptidyl-peptidase-4